MLISSPFSVHLGHAWEALRNYIKMMILWIGLSYSLGSKDDFRLICGTVVLSIFTLSVPRLLTGVTVVRSSVGTTYDPNDLSLILVTCLPFVFYVLRTEKIIIKAVSFITLVAAIVTIVSAQSRMGFLAMILLGLLYVLRQSASLITFFKKISAIGGLVILLLAIATPAYWARMQTIFDEGQTGSGRTIIWKRALKMVAENPLVGVGPGCFTSAYGRMLQGGNFDLVDDSKYNVAWRTAHNTYLKIMAEIGLPGFMLYLWVNFVIWKNLNTIRKASKPFLAENRLFLMSCTVESAFLIFLFGSFFLSQVFPPIWFALISLSVLIRKLANHDSQISKDAPLTSRELTHSALSRGITR